MKLNYYKENIKKELEFKKVNIIYGHSGAGKTKFAKILEDGLNGKDKSFRINGNNIIKDENNVIFIDSKESINEHLKLTSKSYLKKLYYKPVSEYLNENENFLNNINSNFTELNNKLKGISEKFNNRSSLINLNFKFQISNNETLINDCISIELNNDISSSKSRELLFNLITLLNENDSNTCLIIDNFDSYLDEEAILSFFNLIKNFKGYIFLFTNKSNSLVYAIDNFGIFTLKNGDIYNLSNMSYLFNNSCMSNETNLSFEEYMLNDGYLKSSGILNEEYNKIKNSSVYNLGRLLTTKHYKITNTLSYEDVCIIPNSEIEEKFLIYINNLVNND